VRLLLKDRVEQGELANCEAEALMVDDHLPARESQPQLYMDAQLRIRQVPPLDHPHHYFRSRTTFRFET
jgi:hypothetical protein